jgi:hypothetical protein
MADSHWHTEEHKAIRLVVDEAHQILSHRTFRTQFTKIKELAPFKVQKIYITGSLPVRLERRFLLEANLSYTTRIVRAPTFQPPISYNLFHVSSMTTKPVRLATDITKFLETIMEPDQIGIIFSKGRKEVDELHANLTHCSSHSDLPTSDRAHNEAEWRAGYKRWIAATTGLIHGIDAPNVGAVIFLDLPYGLINLYQGAGRSGRDNRRSWVIIIHFTNIHQLAPGNQDDDMECITEGAEFLARVDCRRLPLSETLDGRHDSCTDIPEANLCDVCDTDSVIVAGITPLLRDPILPMITPRPQAEVTMDEPDEYDRYNDSQTMDLDFEQFEQLAALSRPAATPTRTTQMTFLSSQPSAFATPLSTAPTRQHRLAIAPSHLIPPTSNAPSPQILHDISIYHQNVRTLQTKSSLLNKFTSRLSRKCVLCWAYTGVFEPQHQRLLWVRCKPGPDYIRTDWIAFKKRFQFVQYQNCFRCWLPQGDFLPPCHPVFRIGEIGRKPCPMQDFVVLLVLMIRFESSLWSKAQLAFRTLPAQPDEAEFATWCMRVEHAENFYNGLELVLWFFTVHKI